jgi:hypothetical protein
MIFQFFHKLAEAKPSTVAPHWTSFVRRPSIIGRTTPQNFSQALFDETLSSLPNNKATGPDQICNEWLKNSPKPVRKILFACLQRIWEDNLTLPEWLALSKTILLFKPGKDDPTIVKNYRPIALANTIYKLYTKMVASIIQTYAESNSLIDSLVVWRVNEHRTPPYPRVGVVICLKYSIRRVGRIIMGVVGCEIER